MSRWFLLLSLMLGTALLGHAQSTVPVAPGANPAVTLTDPLGLGWQHELVHYDLVFSEPAAMPAGVQVTTADGAIVDSQTSNAKLTENGLLSSVRVWFFAEVPANGATAYILKPGVNPDPKRQMERVGTAQGTTNGQPSISLTTTDASAPAAKPVGITLPFGGATYEWPVDVAQVPGPVQALQLADGRETGPGRWEVPFRVKSWSSELVESGPLFAEVEVTYVFDVGYWTFRARVIRGVPVVRIWEDLDTGHSGMSASDADRFYSVDLLPTTGAKPNQLWYIGLADPDKETYGDLKSDHVEKAWMELGHTRPNWFISHVNGMTLPLNADREDYRILGYPAHQPRIGGLARAVEPGGNAIGMMGMDTTYWRNPHGMRVRETADGGLRLALPLQAYERRWPTDGFADGSENYTGISLFVPDSTIRRAWGLMLTPAEDENTALLTSLFRTTAQLDAHTLDTIKDWNLVWPDPLAGTEWPAESSETGKRAIAFLRDKVAFFKQFGHWAEYSMGYHQAFAMTNYGDIKAVAQSTTDLSAADRAEFRRLVAFLVYDVHSTETFPYGTGFHLNNPNMTIMAVDARAKGAMLIPDHPMYRPWGDVTLALMKAFFERFTRPNGAPYENAHYTLGVTFTRACEVNNVLMEAGIGDAFDTPLFRRSMQFALNYVTPPDLRFGGHRVVIPFGNASYQSYTENFTRLFVTYYKDRDPEYASQLQWIANTTLPEDKQFHIMPESTPPPLTSVAYKDYGVYFRHGFGTPYETLFFMLAGDCNGHFEWETDQMAYTLYAKGQPINLHFGNGYFSMFCRPWLRNRVSFDHMYEKSEINETHQSAVALGPSMDYVQAQRTVHELRPITEYPAMDGKGKALPEERENWGADKEFEEIPPVTWHRQVLFMKDPDPKGPNYFVMRESFSGTPTRPTDLSLWFLANEMSTPAPDTYHFDGQLPVDMDVFVHSPAGQAPETGKFGHINQPYVRLVKDDMNWYPNKKRREDQLFIRFKQPAGAGYMVVLYPRLKDGDPAAQFERLSPDAVKVATTLSTDYVFANPFGTSWTGSGDAAGLAFTGSAGAIRLYADGRRELVNTEGKVKATVAGQTITGSGGFTVTIAADGTAVTTKQTDNAIATVVPAP